MVVTQPYVTRQGDDESEIGDVNKATTYVTISNACAKPRSLIFDRFRSLMPRKLLEMCRKQILRFVNNDRIGNIERIQMKNLPSDYDQ